MNMWKGDYIKTKRYFIKTLSNAPQPEKPHSFENPPVSLLSDAFTGNPQHRARPEWVWGQNFVYKGNEKEIVGDKTQL